VLVVVAAAVAAAATIIIPSKEGAAAAAPRGSDRGQERWRRRLGGRRNRCRLGRGIGGRCDASVDGAGLVTTGRARHGDGQPCGKRFSWRGGCLFAAANGGLLGLDRWGSRVAVVLMTESVVARCLLLVVCSATQRGFLLACLLAGCFVLVLDCGKMN